MDCTPALVSVEINGNIVFAGFFQLTKNFDDRNGQAHTVRNRNIGPVMSGVLLVQEKGWGQEWQRVRSETRSQRKMDRLIIGRMQIRLGPEGEELRSFLGEHLG